MTRKSMILAALVSSLAMVPAFAQSPQGELLLINPPSDWTALPTQKNETMSLTRMLPPGQTEADWSEMITVQIYPGSDITPRNFVENVISYSRANCEAAGAGSVNESLVNNYPFAAVSVTCTKGNTSGKGSVVMVQSLRGRDALYVVQHQWRGPAFNRGEAPAIPKTIVQGWREFGMGLCDTRAPERHPCPK